MGRILLVDGNNLVHRYHDTMADARGPACYIGGLFGIINGVKKFLLAEPSHDAVVYVVDKGIPPWRFTLCPEYKQQRRDKNAEDQLHYDRYKEQVKHVRNVIRHTGCAYAYAKGYEGDDVIAALTLKRFANEEVTIYSSDRDFVELVDGKRVRLFSPIKNLWEPEDPFYTIERCLDPKQSDNLDGAPGVGEVAAAAAVQLWQFDLAATHDPAQPNPFPRSSGKALENFLLWCTENAKWGLTDKQVTEIADKDARKAMRAQLDTLSKDQRTGYKAAAKIVAHADKIVKNYECTSLRWVAKLCDPATKVIVEPPNREEFRETMRAYGMDPIVQNLPALWPVFERLKNDRLVPAGEVVSVG